MWTVLCVCLDNVLCVSVIFVKFNDGKGWCLMMIFCIEMISLPVVKKTNP